MRILLVEDEKRMASFIKRGLEEERYLVDIATSGEKAVLRKMEKAFSWPLLSKK